MKYEYIGEQSITIHGNGEAGAHMREPRITAERVRELLHYDPETGVVAWKARPLSSFVDARAGKIWNTKWANRPAGYVQSCRPYILLGIGGVRHLAHRLAWLYMTGLWPTGEIDHKDGDGLNNRWSNLRDVTPSMNQQNRRKAQSGKKTGAPLGVQRGSGPDNWIAVISAQGKKHHLGSFSSQTDAHAAYVEAKRRMHPGCTI